MARSNREIKNQIKKAEDWINAGETSIGGLTYEDGVLAALSWVLDEVDEAPIENEFTSDEDCVDYEDEEESEDGDDY